jgi:hypothetical protein
MTCRTPWGGKLDSEGGGEDGKRLSVIDPMDRI